MKTVIFQLMPVKFFSNQFEMPSTMNLAHTTRSAYSDSQTSDISEDKYEKLLRYAEDVAPVMEDLTDERKQRRLLDYVRNVNVVRQLNSTNERLDVASVERHESDILLEKLNSTRLDNLQRRLVAQIKEGFDALRNELDEAKERMRIATEKLYQDEVDYEIARKQLRENTQQSMDLLTDEAMRMSQHRVDADIADEHDVRTSCHAEYRERLLPLEHSDINDVESSVAQKAIRKELAELMAGIQEETRARIAEEKAQAARMRAITDALRRGLKIVNLNPPAQ